MEKAKLMWKLFVTFLKIGSFTFGGGMAMLPLIQHESVEKNHWVSEEEIIDYLAMAQSLPGVIAINSATFIGNRVLGPMGAIAASAGMIVPAFFAILIILIFLGQWRGNVYVDKVLLGVSAGSVALILVSAIQLGKSVLKTKSTYVIAIASFMIVWALQMSAAFAIIFGGITGYWLLKWKRRGEK